MIKTRIYLERNSKKWKSLITPHQVQMQWQKVVRPDRQTKVLNAMVFHVECQLEKQNSFVEDLQGNALHPLVYLLWGKPNIIASDIAIPRKLEQVLTSSLSWRGPKKSQKLIHEDTQLELSRDWERPHNSTPYEDVSEASPRTCVPF